MKFNLPEKAIVAAMVCGFLGGCDDDGTMMWSRTKDVEGATTITSEVRVPGGALTVALECPGSIQPSWGATPSAEMTFTYTEDSGKDKPPMLRDSIEITSDGTTRRVTAQRDKKGALSVRFVGGPPPAAVAALLGEAPHANSLGDAKSTTFWIELDGGRRIAATLNPAGRRFSSFVAECREKWVMMDSEPKPSRREIETAAAAAIRDAVAPHDGRTRSVVDELNIYVEDVEFDGNGRAVGNVNIYPRRPLATKMIAHTQKGTPFAFAKRFPSGERYPVKNTYLAQKDGFGGWIVRATVDPSEFSALRDAVPDDRTLPDGDSKEFGRAAMEADQAATAETDKRKIDQKTQTK